MKTKFIKLSALMFALLICAVSSYSVFAEQNENGDDTTADAQDNAPAANGGVLTINGLADAKVGDTVSFTLNLSECKEEIIGFELRFFYDSNLLGYVDDSLVSEEFDDLVYNPHLDGKIPMNWTNVFKPANFSTKKAIFTCDFTVKDGGSTELSYFVTELYNNDMETLKSYKFTYDLSVNGEKVIDDGVLAVSQDADTLYANQGGFINYIDGMGEENTPNKADHQSIIGNQGPVTYTEVVNEVQDVTRVVDGNGGSSPMIYFIIAIPIVAVLIAAGVFFIVKKSKNR